MSLKTLKKQGGFTLLELLIVIVIIGILALLIIPNITSAPKKARDTDRKTSLRAIQKGLEEYFVSNNAYPAALTELSDTTGGATPIIKTIPVDPKNVSPYVYSYTPGNGNTTYTLTGCLENAADSGTSVVAPVSPCLTKTFSLTNNN